jgi:FdhE protein
MTARILALAALKRLQPEWRACLAMLGEVLRETANPAWDVWVLARSARSDPAAPAIAGAGLMVRQRPLRILFERLVRNALSAGTEQMISLRGALHANLDIVALFRASICHDIARIRDIAEGCKADTEAVEAVATLLAVPLLHACNRRWAPSTETCWKEGYCPICGSWPVFAELRGSERERYLRCGRCSGEWRAQAMRCPYCGETDPGELVALADGQPSTRATIEACTRCHRYVKTFTNFHGCPHGSVILEDLASLALDLAAVGQGFGRPKGVGYPLDVAVSERRHRRGVFNS